ncbi:Scr1 family TA system antitoxin-like transcriptional regulator [Streptomyces sp. JH002]|uniref:Scr1 family TA system antitoxin-like transcriptional regulator n=1 Tax=Streptomyces sp. JH002 TaxID=2763259 RepID=UPI003D8082AD
MRSIADFQGAPDDVAEAVCARLSRARYLYEGRHRFVVLLEEWVLHSLIGTEEEKAGQLTQLLNVMLLPSVSLGNLPLGTPRTVSPLEAFYLYDDHQAVIETLMASITVRQPRELGGFVWIIGRTRGRCPLCGVRQGRWWRSSRSGWRCLATASGD